VIGEVTFRFSREMGLVDMLLDARASLQRTEIKLNVVGQTQAANGKGTYISLKGRYKAKKGTRL
jgi:hypothetical protein